MPRVAFLGLGAIGAPMARHLARRFDTAIWNRTASKAVAFASQHHGATLARTPAEAVRTRDIIVTCLPTSRDVEALLDGANGLLAGLSKDAIVVDCTSGDPTTTRRIAARLAEHGVSFLDAPVSGGTNGAEKGELTVMIGGDRAALERARPAIEAFGKNIIYCGAVGSAHAIKAVNQGLLAINIWSAAEGLVALKKAGVDPRLALEAINASSGRSNATMNLIPTRVLDRSFPRTFKLALLDKDVAIAADVAREQKVPSPMLQLAAELFRAAHGALGEEADHVEAVKLVEQWARAEIS